MIALLAGRAAEALVFDEVSTGATDDLAKATDIARECVTRFGMSEVRQVVLEPRPLQRLNDGHPSMHDRDYSETTARQVDVAVHDTIDGAFEDAKKLLSTRTKT